MASNVLGDDLQHCSLNPVTGFYRNGLCDTCADDKGLHTVCAVMTDDFLKFSAEAGNDLSTPVPEYQFPGLQAGDRWCLCLSRWIEALNADMAPEIVLESCHISVTEFVDIEVLKKYAVKNES
tara:strand:- start:10657 stop:11025 length:369 start_codon:yes stop_codon:yes gene_type:complete